MSTRRPVNAQLTQPGTGFVAELHVLLLGGTGQLGRCLLDRCPASWRISAPASTQLNICDEAAVARAVVELRPDLIINAAAYNKVDQAEQDAPNAYAINARGPCVLAEAAAAIGAHFVHISSDYVFDGVRQGVPYCEHDEAQPLNVYGKSKLAGEQAVLQTLSTALVLRTAWLYSEYGHNFVKTVFRAVQNGQPLQVVNDQTGCPTYAGDLAAAIIELTGRGNAVSGLHHYCGAQAVSWYEFACRIVALAGVEESGVEPIGTTAEGRAARPAFSAMSCAKIASHGVQESVLDDSLRYVMQRLRN